jgi:16S rRNA (cytosine967-C5)-methyltransferase
VPDHAAVDLAVRLVQADRRAARFPGLVNAVLRRVVRDGADDLAAAGSTPLDTPDWLFRRWAAHYGEETAREIASAQRHPPTLDLTVKSEAAEWAARLRGIALPTGSVRTMAHGPVARLPGFDEGQWWVQDAAAALPARLLGDVAGRRVADLCAAPGGKTAQLALAGAQVTAVDRSAKRLARLAENLARLGLRAELVAADATQWEPDPFDAVLLDAPCLATGTIRRHPDIAWLKREADLTALTELQRRLLDQAVSLTRPGGVIVYCTCSLEPEEGEQQITDLLARDSRLRRRPLGPSELAGLDDLLTAEGDLRTLPCHMPADDPRLAGLDGFYASRLERV